jgi:hypothetical protein
VFLSGGLMELTFNGEELSFEEPEVLEVPYYRTPEGPALKWEKEIDFDLGGGLKVKGFAALRRTGSVSQAGFALFRRGRLIQGSGDESYRPREIFEDPNSFIFQRLFGELQLDGFEVSHTKDGFRWDENEETFLSLLKEHLNSEPLPLLDQARGYRVRPRPQEIRTGAEAAVQSTATVIQTAVATVLEGQVQTAPDDSTPPPSLPDAATSSSRTIDIDLRGTKWRITIELSSDPAVGEWLTVFDEGRTSFRLRKVFES